MPLTTAGLPILARAAARGLGGPALGQLSFGIGDGGAAFSAGQIDLVGATKARQSLLVGFPTASGSTTYFAADFPPGSAPSELREFGIFASDTMLSRLVVSDFGEIPAQHTCSPQMNLNVTIGGGGPFTTIGKPIFAAAIAKGLAGAQALQLFMGLGDGDAPFDADQVDLQGSSKVRRPLANGYPQVAGAELRLVADFEPGAAPAAMREVALFDAASGGSMIYRAVADLGEASPFSGQSPMIILSFELT